MSVIKQSGFTIIELVVTIILVGIVSAYVVPKLSNSFGGYGEYTTRTEAIIKLRTIQYRAMQQAQICALVSDQYLGQPNNGSCLNSPSFNINAFQINETNMVVDGDVQFAFQNGDTSLLIRFNGNGQPIGTCANGCTFSVRGQQDLQIRINSEGYIYAL